MQLRVDVLYPNEDVPLGKVLANISSRGCLYAILVTNQHEEHNSITVNILYGQPAEHRNMPVDDALKLIGKDFQNKMAVESSKRLNSSHLPQPVPIIPATNVIAPPLKDRHPESIQILLNLLADNLPLTGLQYERIIKYLNERRTLQLKAELGETVESIPDPEIELQKKILDILNKPSVAETHYELLYPTLQSIKDDFRVMELLKDERVQKALDSLMDSSLVGTIETHMKF
ncbi:nuclear receptor coactivator 5-like [Teleopsis dalmanni]|nr:nuclear receptor coactivator 5-like [Teleopsis dalmanni]